MCALSFCIDVYNVFLFARAATNAATAVFFAN